jgi:hypothetical protein
MTKEEFEHHMLKHGKKLVNSQKERKHQRLSLAVNPNTSLERLLTQLQQKLRVMFPGIYEAFRFFDFNSNGRCTKEHFVFNCTFLHLDFPFSEVLELFHVLDSKNDGHLDETEFS